MSVLSQQSSEQLKTRVEKHGEKLSVTSNAGLQTEVCHQSRWCHSPVASATRALERPCGSVGHMAWWKIARYGFRFSTTIRDWFLLHMTNVNGSEMFRGYSVLTLGKCGMLKIHWGCVKIRYGSARGDPDVWISGMMASNHHFSSWNLISQPQTGDLNF